MSTANLTGIDALRAAVTTSAQNVRERSATVLSEAANLEKKRQQDAENAAIAARILQQQTIDEQSVLNEEAGQLASILGVTPAPVSAPAVPAGAAPAAVVAPAAPTAAAAPAAPTTCCTPDPHAHASASATATSGTVVLLNPRSWSGVSWLFAIIGALIGIVVAANTWHPLFSDVNGFGRGLLTVLWFIALTALGFFGGGLLGWRVEGRNDRE